MLTIEKLTDRDSFSRLEPIWNALLERSDANTIALTFEWLSTWWDVFGAGRELFILAVRDGDEIIGLAPLLKRRVRNMGLPCRRLEFLASGEDEADEICSDYLDFILLRGRESEILAAILDYLRHRDTDWDELVLKSLCANSPTATALSHLAISTGLKCRISSDGEAVYLPLPASREEFLSGVSRKMRGQIGKNQRAGERAGVQLRVAEQRADFDDAFADLSDLHQKVWTSRGQPGVFASEKFTRFHRDLSTKLLPKNQIRLFLLYDGDKAISGLYVFCYNNKEYLYQSGCSNDSPVHSPGTLVRMLAIEKAIERGVGEWDFLKSDSDSYKYRWSKSTRAIVQARLAPLRPKEAVLTTAQGVINSLRGVKRTLKP